MYFLEFRIWDLEFRFEFRISDLGFDIFDFNYSLINFKDFAFSLGASSTI
jgi:hypothetical protein